MINRLSMDCHISLLRWLCTIGINLTALIFIAPLSAHESCDTCHRETNPTEQQASLVQDLPGLCLVCHEDRVGDGEHIIGVFPFGTTGPLPLVNGKLDCTTCHDPHGQQPKLLRITKEELCMTCHKY